MSAPDGTGFVGRTAELDDLSAAVADRSVTTVLLGGEAGVGKTRLVGELRNRLEAAGAIVAVGSCIHTANGSLPFVAVTEVLRSLRADLPDAVDHLPARVLDEVAVLVPELGDTVRPVGPADDRTVLRLFDAIATALNTLGSARPVCLVIEDLHWADASTRDLVTFLAHAATETTIVATYRSDEIARTHPLRPLLAELDRIPRVRHLVVPPFDIAELTRFAAAELGEQPSARVVDELAERSNGNAFFASELLASMRAGRRDVRPELADLVLSRVESLSLAAQTLLRMIAVSGESVRDELLELVLEPDEAGVLDVLGEVVEQRLVVVGDDGRMRFRHALMQETVYGSVLPRERRNIHRRFAEVLSERPDLSASTIGASAELAWHYREAREVAASLRASVDAANAAMAVPAFSEALGHVRNLLELWDDLDEPGHHVDLTHVELLRWAADLSLDVGDAPQAAAYQRAAIAESDGVEPEVLGLLHERLGRFLQAAGRSDGAIVEYERGVELVPDPARPERAVVMAGYGQQLMLTLRHREAVVALDEAIAVARRTGNRAVEGHALNSLGSMRLHDGRYGEGVAHLERAGEIARAEGEHVELLRVHVNLVSGLTQCGDLARAERVAREGLALAGELGHESFFIGANLVTVLVEMGRWEEAAEVDRSLRRPEGGLPRMWLVHAAFDRAFRCGELVEAARVLDDIERSSSVLEPQLVPMHLARRADLALAAGDRGDARGLLSDALAAAVTLPQELELHLRCAELGLDEADDAVRALLDAMERLMTERFDPEDVGAHGVLAVAAEGRAHRAVVVGDDPLPHWQTAVDEWTASGAAWRRTRARLGQAEARLRAGDRDGARTTLDLVVAEAEEMGTSPLAEAARRLLHQAGLGDDETPPSELLTARERDVLRLVAEGRTNRQIGDRLFISPKTASVHVSRILQKLGVENRTEAAAAARRAGLVDDQPA